MATDGKLNVLTTLDQAKTQRYHFMAIVIAGMAFFTDAYDLFCITLVPELLCRIYYTDDPGRPDLGILPRNVSAAVTGVALCGTLTGQLFFGWLGDELGSKSVYGFTLILMVISSVVAADMSKVLNTEIVKDVQRSGETSTTGEGSNQECGGSSRRSSRAGTGLHLVVTTSTWFLLDVAFFSQNLFQKDIFSMAGWIPLAKTMNAVDRGGVPHRALRRHPGLLVHRRVHRRRRPLRHPARGLPHDGRLHARPRRAVPPLDHAGQPDRLRRHVRVHILLRQFRAQLHHLHRAGRDLPGEAEVHLPRHLGGDGEGRRVPLSVRGAGPPQPGAWILARHRHPEHADRARRDKLPRDANDAARAGVQGVIARGDISKEAVADDEAA